MSAFARSTEWVWLSSEDELKCRVVGLDPLSLPQAISTREAGMARSIPPTRKMTSRRFRESMSGGPGTPPNVAPAPSPPSQGLRKDRVPCRLPDLMGRGCLPDGVCLDFRGVAGYPSGP